MSEVSCFTMKLDTLTITAEGGHKIGNCYYANFFVVKSFNKPLTEEIINGLFKLGLLGYGQELIYRIDNMKTEAADDYNKYFTLTVENRVDSSD